MINESNKVKNYSGFSLIEVVVAIAIISVLTSIIAIVFVQYTTRSRRATDIYNAREIREAFDRVILNKSSVTSTGGTELTSIVTWNKDTQLNKSPQSLVDSLLLELGKVPVSVTNEDYIWCVEYNNTTEELGRIYLTPTAGSDKKYELYPNYQQFLSGE